MIFNAAHNKEILIIWQIFLYKELQLSQMKKKLKNFTIACKK